MTLTFMGAEMETFARSAAAGAHAEGMQSIASGQYSHAEGSQGTASGANAHAEGNSCTASGQYSHAGGVGAAAFGYAAWTHGGPPASTLSAYKAQRSIYGVSAILSGGVDRKLTFDAALAIVTSGPGANVLLIPQFSAFTFTFMFCARQSNASGATNGSVVNGFVMRDSGVPKLLGTTVVNSWADVDGSCGYVNFSVDTSLNYLVLTGSQLGSWSTSIHGTLIVNELVMYA